MSKLSLATTILAIHLTNAAGLEATEQNRIPLLAPSGEAEAPLTEMQRLSCSDEILGIGLGSIVSIERGLG